MWRSFAPGSACHALDAGNRTPVKNLPAALGAERFWQVRRSVSINHRHIASAVRVDEGHVHLSLRRRPETLTVSRHFTVLFKVSAATAWPWRG